MTRIGSNIKKIRTTKGLSQQAFADLFELTRGNISSYEESRAEPRIEFVIKIANYFGIPVEKFITDNLTINEILRFNGDKLMEEEHHILNLQLREVPFMNDNIYMRCCHGDLRFSEWDSFPKLILPETTNNNLVALTFNSNIPHHASLPDYQMHDVLVFEELTRQNIHLCHHKIGLYSSPEEIMIGQYKSNDGTVELVLNDFTKHAFTFESSKQFWKLFAVYAHKG